MSQRKNDAQNQIVLKLKKIYRDRKELMDGRTKAAYKRQINRLIEQSETRRNTGIMKRLFTEIRQLTERTTTRAKAKRKYERKILREVREVKTPMEKFVSNESIRKVKIKVIAGNVRKSIKTILDKINFNNPQYYYILGIEDKKETLYTLNERTRAKLYKTIKGDLVYVMGGGSDYSDREWSAIVETNISFLTLYRKKYKNRNQNDDGGFFKYYHTTEIDLTKYQIFKQNDENENYDDNCLIYALKKSGKLEQHTEELLKGYVRNRDIARKDLQQICEKCNFQIHLKKYSESEEKTRTTEYGKNGEIFELGLVAKHFFLNEKTIYSTYSIKNYSDVKDEKEFENIIKKRGTKYERGKKNKINSYELIKQLYLNKEKYLKNIDISNGIIHQSQFYNEIKDDYYYDEKENLEYPNLETAEKKKLKYCFNCGGKFIRKPNGKMFISSKINLMDQDKKQKEYFNYCFNCDEENNIQYLEEMRKKALEELIENHKIKKTKDFSKYYPYHSVFFDFETYTKETEKLKQCSTCKQTFERDEKTNQLETIINTDCKECEKYIEKTFNAYLVCCIVGGIERKVFNGELCGLSLLEFLAKKGIKDKVNFRMIAHNVGFDFRFLMRFMKLENGVEKGKKMISFSALYKGIRFSFKDSCNLIPMTLSYFGKVFNLEQSKEIMPYALYNIPGNIKKRFIKIDEALKFINKEDQPQFIDNLKKWHLINLKDKTFDIIRYAEIYCLIDCEVLMNGYNKFNEWMYEMDPIINLDIGVIPTIASLSDKYITLKGCYDDVELLCGKPQIFISRCIVGGRTMCRKNEKIKIDCGEAIDDFDGVSLYPSAISRMKGYLKGYPKVLNEFTYTQIKKYDGYFIAIKILEVGKTQNFPLISFINSETSVREFTNDAVDKILYVDKVGLEDLIEFHKIKFEIIKGYYYDEGVNTKIIDVIKFLFNERLKKKSEGNPIELVYKLIMNTIYGKSILKPIDYDYKFFNKKEEYQIYLSKNYNKISEITVIKNRFTDKKNGNEVNNDKYKLKEYKDLTIHENRPQVGVEVLSMSKRIMNEVMSTAEDENITIFYQDTDSMHLFRKDIPKLQAKYNDKYKRELIGKHLGQFHSDFNFKGCKNVYAEKSLFLGKKCYVDCLVGTDEKTGEEKKQLHIRFKGVDNETIKYTAEEEKLNIYELYENMYNGSEYQFDLTRGGTKDRFKFNKNYTICIESVFTRTGKFPQNEKFEILKK